MNLPPHCRPLSAGLCSSLVTGCTSDQHACSRGFPTRSKVGRCLCVHDCGAACAGRQGERTTTNGQSTDMELACHAPALCAPVTGGGCVRPALTAGARRSVVFLTSQISTRCTPGQRQLGSESFVPVLGAFARAVSEQPGSHEDSTIHCVLCRMPMAHSYCFTISPRTPARSGSSVPAETAAAQFPLRPHSRALASATGVFS